MIIIEYTSDRFSCFIQNYLLFPVFKPELPLPTGRFSRVILLWDVGSRPVEREDAAPTPAVVEFTVVPTVFDVEMEEGRIPTPTFPKIAFCAAILLRWMF